MGEFLPTLREKAVRPEFLEDLHPESFAAGADPPFSGRQEPAHTAAYALIPRLTIPDLATWRVRLVRAVVAGPPASPATPAVGPIEPGAVEDEGVAVLWPLVVWPPVSEATGHKK